MTSDDGLRLDDVKQRFAESHHMLDQLSARLEALVVVEDVQSRAGQAVQDAATSLAELVGEIRAVVNELGRSQAVASDALDMTRRALEGTDINALVEQLDGLRHEVAKMHKLVESARTDASEARHELADLQAKVAHIPTRARRKAGLG